ncbi:MAG: cupin domain-containing protein [Chloroflexi bacterium]|nr:cupin domain-containing protein [Chloroflexota bacterium]
MKVVRSHDVPIQDNTGAPIFEGRVTRQPLVSEQMAAGLRLNLITFNPGARTVLHTHTMDQVLVVVAGRGILATEHEEHVVTPGDVVHVPPGERHWHGATQDSFFSHVSITPPGETKLVQR